MSFFDDRPNESPVEPPQPERKPWWGPPDATIGGYLADQLVLVRTPEAVLVVDGLRCFPDGVLLDLHLWLRGAATPDAGHWEPPWDGHHRPGASETSPALRLGVAYADGSSWSNLDVRPWMADPTAEPVGPMLMPRSGGGNPGHWEQSAWLWPLPPDGPVRFVAAWPEQGIEESVAEIDGGRLRQAAEQAQTLWT